MNHIWKAATGALALTLSAGIAHAAVGTPPIAAAQTQASATPKAAVEKRYCIRDTRTGSRVAKTMCRTRKEWQSQGVDPLAPQE